MGPEFVREAPAKGNEWPQMLCAIARLMKRPAFGRPFIHKDKKTSGNTHSSKMLCVMLQSFMSLSFLFTQPANYIILWPAESVRLFVFMTGRTDEEKRRNDVPR